MSPSEIVGEAGEPGLDVDEEVALQQDARADLERRVLVDRRPASLTSIVTTALFVPSWPSTLTTWPMLTPAMRTGDLTLRLFAVGKTALNWKCCVSGLSFVNPK